MCTYMCLHHNILRSLQERARQGYRMSHKQSFSLAALLHFVTRSVICLLIFTPLLTSSQIPSSLLFLSSHVLSFSLVTALYISSLLSSPVMSSLIPPIHHSHLLLHYSLPLQWTPPPLSPVDEFRSCHLQHSRQNRPLLSSSAVQ